MMQIFMEATIIGSLMKGWFELEMLITEAEAEAVAKVEAQTRPSTGWFELGIVLTEVVAVAEVEAQLGESFGGGLRTGALAGAVAVALTGLIGPCQPGNVPQSAALRNICHLHTKVTLKGDTRILRTHCHVPRLVVVGRKISRDRMMMSGEKHQEVD